MYTGNVEEHGQDRERGPERDCRYERLRSGRGIGDVSDKGKEIPKEVYNAYNEWGKEKEDKRKISGHRTRVRYNNKGSEVQGLQ